MNPIASLLLALAPLAARAVTGSGGAVTNYTLGGTNFTAHVFTGNGAFTCAVPGKVEVILVGGGGGGAGADGGGGGGGGGVLYANAYRLAATNYAVTVGAGGVGQNANGSDGGNGSNSVFGGLIAYGGGGGGAWARAGVAGASGGGAGREGGGALGGTAVNGQGFAGGKTLGSSWAAAAGGGGAGTNGADGSSANGSNPDYSAGGKGGNGLAFNLRAGTNAYYGGGGGGSALFRAGGAGGLGGGGTGGNTAAGVNGGANTGGGGGGGRGATGGNGGSGIVIVRYVWNEVPPPFFTDTGVSNVTFTAAEAHTTLGGATADVSLVWDTMDQGETLSAWGATNALGSKSPGLIVGTLTGLSSGALYTCRFFAHDTARDETGWSPPVTFATLGSPLIATLAETNLTYNSAVLNGSVISTGGAPTTVRAYWARTDLWPNYSGWAGTNDFGVIGEGPTNCTAVGLAYSTAYVYRYYATNIHGEAWGQAEPFTTPLPTPTTLTFNNANGDWHTAAHWSPQQVPIGVDTATINGGRTATIQAGNSGAASVIRVGYGGSQIGTLNANGNLTAGGDMTVGSGDGTGAANGTFNLGADTAVNIGGSLMLGTYGYGTLNQGAGASVTVGGTLTVGGGTYQKASLGTYTVPETGTLTLTGPAAELRVAYGYTAAGTFTYNNPSVTLTVPGDMTVASGDTRAPANGTFNLGADTAVNIVGSLMLGTYGHGTLDQGAGASVTVGGTLTVGGNSWGTASSATYTVPETGTLTLTGPAAELRVAYGDSANGTFTYNNPSVILIVPGDMTVARAFNAGSQANGTFNLGANTEVTIGGSLMLGTYGNGTLNQGANTSVTVGGTLTVGGPTWATASAGVYNLANGASLTVTGATTLDAGSSGRLNITVGSSASGLTVGSGLSAGADGQLNITFRADPASAEPGTAGRHTGIHYGLKWAGNRVAELNALGAKLAVDDSTYLSADFKDRASVFYDAATDATYVGFYIYATPFAFTPASVSNVTDVAAETSSTLSGGDAAVYALWGTTDPGRTLAGWDMTNALGAFSPGPIEGVALTNLLPGTYYTVRFYGTNSSTGGRAWSGPASFGTLGGPVVATLPASGLTFKSAVLNGSLLSTGGTTTAVRVYWAQADQGTNHDGWLGTNDFGVMDVGATGCVATALAYSTAYVYRYYATNANGESWGAAEPFATPMRPAQTIDFNIANGDWHSAANWLPQDVPIQFDNAYIFGNRTATIAAGNAGLAGDLNMGLGSRGANGGGTLILNGNLDVTNSMAVATQGGNPPWITCTVAQSAGTTVTVANVLSIGPGVHVSGIYHIDTDAALRAGQVRIADSYDGNGTLNLWGRLIVSGDAGIWNTQGNGNVRPGTINQYENTTATIGGTLYIAGGGTFSSGTYTLGTNAIVTVGGNLSIGNGWGCVGTFNIGTGATVTVAGTVAVGTGSGGSVGTIHMNGDTLAFGGNVTLGSGQLNHNRGALYLPRQTTTSGTFANAGGSLHFGIGGDPASNAFDRVTVSGGTTTLGGDLLVELEGGYKPEATNSYTIITRTGGMLTGVFANAASSGQSHRLGGIEAVVTYSADSVVLSDVRDTRPGCMIIVR